MKLKRSKVPKLKRQSLFVLRHLQKKLFRICQSHRHQPKFSLQHILLSWLGGFLGIATLAYLTTETPYSFIAAPFGATAVLVFGIPDSPLAQPRNVIGGNLIASFLAVTLVHFGGTSPWIMALAVATTIKLMQLTHTVHPPSGAVALLGVLNHASWSYVLSPVFLGSVVIVLCTILFSHAVPGRAYPKHWL